MCQCQKTFDWKGDLERHDKNVHETNPDYEYDPWQKTFTSKNEIGRHVKNVYEANPKYEY